MSAVIKMHGTRTKGHNLDWRPRGKRQIQWLEAIQQYIRENKEYLPVLGRQLFYDLVGLGLASKEPRNPAGKSYDSIKVQQLLNDARRAKLIEWPAIADDDGDVNLYVRERQAPEVIDRAEHILMQYVEMDPWRTQPSRAVIFVEAAGQVTQVRQMVGQYRIKVYASGGFTSSSRTQGFAHSAATLGQPLHVLTIGDLDPSGWQIIRSREADILAFAEDYDAAISFEHIALTEEQARRFPNSIEPMTAKDWEHSHAHQYPYRIKVQSAALQPADLKPILLDRIEELIVNRKSWDAVIATEWGEKESVVEQVLRWKKGEAK